jgi:hypothetical protein
VSAFQTPERIVGTGYRLVTMPVSCVMTRFRLRSAISLLRFYVHFRVITRAAGKHEGLLKAVFLIGGVRTCYTLSFWSSDLAIIQFNTRIVEHVRAANEAFRATWNDELGRAEVWSAQFQLYAVSRDHLSWEGLDEGVLESTAGTGVEKASGAKRNV